MSDKEPDEVSHLAFALSKPEEDRNSFDKYAIAMGALADAGIDSLAIAMDDFHTIMVYVPGHDARPCATSLSSMIDEELKAFCSYEDNWQTCIASGENPSGKARALWIVSVLEAEVARLRDILAWDAE